jgi:hypothetical protein
MDDKTYQRRHAWLLIFVTIGFAVVLWLDSQQDKVEPVKQTEPAKERRVITIIKWLWEKD